MAEVLNKPVTNMDPNSYKITPKKIFIHLKTILKHKYYVFIFCCKAGIPWRGIKHDLSKFSPAEFIPNAKYAEEGISPIDVQKVVIGYASSWFHHKGRNSHHYEYWIDKLDNGGYITRMPFLDALECICDMLAANRVYKGKTKNEFSNLWNFWSRKRVGIAMHPDTVQLLSEVFYSIKIFKDHKLNKKVIRSKYNRIIKENGNPIQMKLSDVIDTNELQIMP